MKKVLIFAVAVLCMLTLHGQTAIPPSAGDGSAENPFQIANLGNLRWIAENGARWDKHYIQTADIDAADTYDWQYGYGWAPIANSTKQFSGIYDGRNFVIDSLYINRSQDYVGLFAFTKNAVIKNVVLTNFLIKEARTHTGALAGYGWNTSFDNCHSSGLIQKALSNCGGLIGVLSASTLINSHSDITILSAGTEVGGLVGYNYKQSLIDHCYSTGIVNGVAGVGGLVGYNHYASLVRNSYSRAQVDGLTSGNYDSNFGGFAGISAQENSTIENCYSTGTVSGGDFRVHGFVGTCSANPVIACF